MRTLKLTLAYDGAEFCGWQVQPGQRTVQQTLQEALAKVTGETIVATASGRTDSGVHALAQAVGLVTDSRLSNEALLRALNAELPRDVRVLEVSDAPEGFDAIRDVRRKRYRYILNDGPLLDVFSHGRVWHLYRRLDQAAMQRAGQALVGTHDFTSYATTGSQRVTTVRTVFELIVERRAIRGISEPDPRQTGEVRIEVEADGFLYNMVRNIVGTLVEVGRDMQDEAWPAAVLAARDRRAAGQTAPPEGLYLVRVEY
jgi:tRNA pseudouridine38-40 synthase